MSRGLFFCRNREGSVKPEDSIPFLVTCRYAPHTRLGNNILIARFVLVVHTNTLECAEIMGKPW